MKKFVKFIFLGMLLALTIKFWTKKEITKDSEKELHLVLSTPVDNLDPAVSTSHYSAILSAKVRFVPLY